MPLAPVPERSLAEIHILIAEDDDMIRELLADILTLEGAEVTVASSGNEAAALLKSVRPQLIISDVMMVDGDGHELLKVVQADPVLNGIPFIFLTARSEPSEFRRSMNLGADDYLIKPVARQDLINAVRTRLIRSKVAGRCQRQMEDQLRDELARSVPHELLAPLQTIRGATEILAMEEGLPAACRELTEMISKGCDRMTLTVKRFWRWTELQSDLQNCLTGEYPSHARGAVHSDRLVELAVNLCARDQRETDLKLAVTPTTLPICEDHLRLLGQELLDNALKFSAPGQPMELSLREVAGGWELGVADQGIGLTSELLDDSGQLRASLRRRLGLGLNIARMVAKLNGFKLSLDPARKTGTAFTVFIPKPTV